MKKYFTDIELETLPLLYSNVYTKNKFQKKQFTKSIKSDFYQNSMKEKQRQIAKPISRLFNEDDIL
jgi:hypothetical protein